MNIIETVGLGKSYGRIWALRDCTFAMPEGHLAALVGPNGAGKTTLLHLLVGLTTAAAGTAAVLGGCPSARAPRWTASRSSRRTRPCTRT